MAQLSDDCFAFGGTLLSVDAALALIAERVVPVVETESVPLAETAGRVAELEPDIDLPPMPIGEQVVEDYRHLHLSLKAHPCSFLRGELRRRGVTPHERHSAASDTITANAMVNPNG